MFVIVSFVVLWFAGVIFYGSTHPEPFPYPDYDYPTAVPGDLEP